MRRYSHLREVKWFARSHFTSKQIPIRVQVAVSCNNSRDTHQSWHLKSMAAQFKCPWQEETSEMRGGAATCWSSPLLLPWRFSESHIQRVFSFHLICFLSPICCAYILSHNIAPNSGGKTIARLFKRSKSITSKIKWTCNYTLSCLFPLLFFCHLQILPFHLSHQCHT